MGQRGLSFRVFALCVATACAHLLAACGHDDGGQSGGSVPAARWARTYGGTSADVANSVQPTADGGYIVAGSTSSFGAGDTDAWVLKLDAKGNVLWQKTYGGAGEDGASAVQPTTDGGYLVVGYARPLARWPDAWVMKLDGSGNIVQEGTYGSPNGEYSLSVEPTPAGGFMLASGHQGLKVGMSAVYVMGLDAGGNISWSRVHSNVGTYHGSVQPTADGGYVVASGSAEVAKMDPNGGLTWQKRLAPSPGVRYYTLAMRSTADGGYVIVGWTEFGFDGNRDALAMKLGSSGDVIWQKTYGGAGMDAAVDVRPTPDGGYLVVGSTTSFGAGGRDAWLMKLDASGNIIRQLTYGGAGDDAASAVQSTADGGYVIAGYTASFGAGGTDAWLMKVDANGAIPGCALIASSGAMAVVGSATEYDADTVVVPGIRTLVSHTAVSAESTAVASEQCRNE
jgi:hypothetical protein